MTLSHDIADYPEGIVLAIDKPYRWTSADVIRKLKYAAIRHFRKKNLKVGHAGTLDPLATGVLLVCIGPACRRAQQLQDHDKEYVATVRFGATTPSYDLEKEVDRTFPYAHITQEAVQEALKGFVGEQEQIAPLFSAKSVDGVRAYEVARRLYRGGRFSEIDATALETLHRSRIVISEIELLDFTPARPATGTPAADALPDGSDLPGPSALPTPPIAGDGPLPLMWPGVATGPDRSLPSGQVGSASARIHVADTASLGLPEARIRIVCSKGTYIRAFARDLGEALGSGAHLGGLIRSRSGDYRLAEALSVEEALSLFYVDLA